MDPSHIKLQFSRLKRHHELSLNKKDQVAFLDLSHVLRVFVDMRREVDQHISDRGLTLEFQNTQKDRRITEALDNSKYFSLPISRGVKSPNVQIKGLTVVGRTLSPEEVKQIYEAGPPISIKTQMSFTDWLGASIIDTNSPNNKEQPKLSISREILIKRVANILGASHPAGMEEGTAGENRFDSYIQDLNNVEVADGYPLTYYQLLEISAEIICVFDPIFGG